MKFFTETLLVVLVITFRKVEAEVTTVTEITDLEDQTKNGLSFIEKFANFREKLDNFQKDNFQTYWQLKESMDELGVNYKNTNFIKVSDEINGILHETTFPILRLSLIIIDKLEIRLEVMGENLDLARMSSCGVNFISCYDSDDCIGVFIVHQNLERLLNVIKFAAETAREVLDIKMKNMAKLPNKFADLEECFAQIWKQRSDELDAEIEVQTSMEKNARDEYFRSNIDFEKYSTAINRAKSEKSKLEKNRMLTKRVLDYSKNYVAQVKDAVKFLTEYSSQIKNETLILLGNAKVWQNYSHKLSEKNHTADALKTSVSALKTIVDACDAYFHSKSYLKVSIDKANAFISLFNTVLDDDHTHVTTSN